MSAQRSSITDLAGFVKSIMKMDNPHKNWPTIARLPGDFKQAEDTKFKPNLVAYQVCTCTSGRAVVGSGSGGHYIIMLPDDWSSHDLYPPVSVVNND